MQVKENSTYRCEKDCFACVSGSCTALESFSDPCVFYRTDANNRREVWKCYHRLVASERFDLIRKYRETLAELGVFDIELSEADKQKKKLDRFRAENLEEMRRRYGAGEDVILPADLIEESEETDEALPEGEEDELIDNTLEEVNAPGSAEAVLEEIIEDAETEALLAADVKLRDFLDILLTRRNNRLFNEILFTAGVGSTDFEGDLSEEISETVEEKESEETEEDEEEFILWDDEPDPEDELEERDRTPFVEDVLEKQTAWPGNNNLAGKPKTIMQEVLEAQAAGRYWNPYAQAVRVRKIDPIDASYQLLGAAIIYKAVEDYVLTLRELWSTKSGDLSLIVDQITLESFFGSHWYWQLTDLNPEHISWTAAGKLLWRMKKQR